MLMLPTSIPGKTWEDYAACRGLQTALFFPTRGAKPTMAKQTCMGCPVRYACLHAHLHEVIGVWGGMSERERRRYRKYLKVDSLKRKQLTHVVAGRSVAITQEV